MSMLISEEIIDEFWKNGAICLRNVFENVWVETVTRGIGINLRYPGPYSEFLGDEKSYFFDDYCNWQRIPEFESFVRKSPAAEIVGLLMKSQYATFYHEHVLVKESGSSKETPWHHDQSYYPIDGEKVCSIWMPVDYVPESTCLKFVAGSHRWGWFRPRKFATSNPYETIHGVNSPFVDVYKTVPNITEDSGKYNIIKWNLEPGDCIIFHMKTLHGAPGNTHNHSRRVLSTRWLGDDAVMAARPWEVSPPYSGHLKPGDPVSISDEFPTIWKNHIRGQ